MLTISPSLLLRRRATSDLLSTSTLISTFSSSSTQPCLTASMLRPPRHAKLGSVSGMCSEGCLQEANQLLLSSLACQLLRLTAKLFSTQSVPVPPARPDIHAIAPPSECQSVVL